MIIAGASRLYPLQDAMGNTTAVVVKAGSAFAARMFQQGGYGVVGARHAYITSRMYGHVAAAAARVDVGGLAALTRPQRIAVGANPNLYPAFRGNRIDVMARQWIVNDPVLKPLFTRGELQSFYSSGPDFLDPLTGYWWDMTTPTQWQAHVDHYGLGGTLLPTR